MAKAEVDKQAEAKDNPRPRARAIPRSKTSEARAKPNEGEVTVAAIDDSAVKETVAKTNETEAVEMREYAGTETEQLVRQDVRTESNVDAVAVQKIGTEQLESNPSATSSYLDTLQAIAAEASDYSRQSLENHSSFVTKLLGATTFENAIQVQSEHAKASYASFMAFSMKMAEFRAGLVKTFFEPIETAIRAATNR
ncbi:phasin family protein [Methylocapsa sp. D3K7]|uniref:phasin family protein n=1 Tax=Methylocapsa sp. D3K7 TaxID=3041435 RepID=UPI00244EE716|nr:phasin family protein [Methylocapsa sp. D3K7]WGJ16298.1 phasin family protein [Methylocapsa sp. D3K7]